MTENREYCKRVAEEIEEYATGNMTDDNGDELGLYDYLNDVLYFEFTVDSRKEYKSAKIWVTLGGPNVWIDTAERAVRLAWGSDREEYPLDWDVCDKIDEIMQEIYEN